MPRTAEENAHRDERLLAVCPLLDAGTIARSSKDLRLRRRRRGPQLMETSNHIGKIMLKWVSLAIFTPPRTVSVNPILE